MPVAVSYNPLNTSDHEPTTLEEKKSERIPVEVNGAGLPPPGLMKLKKFPKRAVVAPPTFHPDFMFCGSCTDCSTTPAPESAPESAPVPIPSSEESSLAESTTGSMLHTKILVDTSAGLVLKSLLQPMPGVSQVIVEQGHLTVYHDTISSPEDMVRVLQQAGCDGTIADESETSEPAAVVRSTFAVQGICCSSEVPAVRRILRPVPGVSSLQINITTRQVYVQHDAALVSASELAGKLTKGGFRARIVRDGGTVGQSYHDSTTGQTTLAAQVALEAADIEAMEQALADVAGVHRVHVSIETGRIDVEHDLTISASHLQNALSAYPVVVQQDAHVLQAQHVHALVSAPRSNYVESTLLVSNLTLHHVPLLQRVMRQQYIKAQVRAVHPHVGSRMVKVEHDPNVDIGGIVTVLGPYGLEAHVIHDGAVERAFLPLQDEGTAEAPSTEGVPWESHSTMKLHVVLSGVFWALSFIGTRTDGWRYVGYVAGCLSVLFGLPPVALKAARRLRRCEFDANCMMVIAATGAVALREFDEAASVSFLFAVSEYLEARATDKARKALAAIVNLRPEHANLIHPETKQVTVVPAEKVPVGSLISVRTGDKIAADGVVVEGSSSVDESSLTGESIPVAKTVEMVVAGGTINVGTTQLVVRTTRSVQDSTVSRLIRLVEEAQAKRSPTEKMVDGFARAYTPGVVIVAAIMATVPWFFGPDAGRYWTLNALIIVVIACPCALTISTPVTYAAGLAATAQRGIIVKGGASLEALGSVDKVILDKTGTLTEGKFAVTHLEEVGSRRSRKEMLALLALMEAPSSHPLSATLVLAARREGVSVPTDVSVKEHTILKGEGVTATVAGKQVYVGNRRLFERLGMYDGLGQESRDHAEQWSQKGGSVGFLGVQGEGIIGSFCMTDVVRSDARETVTALLAGGIDVIMLTGDGAGAALAVAEQVGIPAESVHSQLLPEDKLRYVNDLKLKTPSSETSFGLFRRPSRVLFCGDGVNDAPALAAADIGISMGEGAALAMEMSDVTLMDSKLSKLLYVVQMGARVMFTVQENIMLSLICKLIVVVLTFAGYMTLMLAIASDVGVMLLVTLNGMKLLPGQPGVSLSDPRRSFRKRNSDELPLAGTGTGGSRDDSESENEII